MENQNVAEQSSVPAEVDRKREELIAELERLDAAKTSQAKLTSGTDTIGNQESGNELETDGGLIDLDKKHKLEQKFQELINNPRYWENANRIKRLEEALVLPVYDNRSLQQFYISAKEELLANEMKSAIDENRAPVMPTEDAIKLLAEKKYADKQNQLAKKTSKKA